LSPIPYYFLSTFPDFLEDWMLQGSGHCARFCRALSPGSPITHFHSEIDWWDGNAAEADPWNYYPSLHCLTLTEVPGQPRPPDSDPDSQPDENDISSSGPPAEEAAAPVVP
jgi:hypothetical protein